jgi:hypothetical protein
MRRLHDMRCPAFVGNADVFQPHRQECTASLPHHAHFRYPTSLTFQNRKSQARPCFLDYKCSPCSKVTERNETCRPPRNTFRYLPFSVEDIPTCRVFVVFHEIADPAYRSHIQHGSHARYYTAPLPRSLQLVFLSPFLWGTAVMPDVKLIRSVTTEARAPFPHLHIHL